MIFLGSQFMYEISTVMILVFSLRQPGITFPVQQEISFLSAKHTFNSMMRFNFRRIVS